MTLCIPCASVDYRWCVYFFAKFPQATRNADSPWLVFPHCSWTLSNADWSLLLSGVDCPSASPFANCLLWVPSSNPSLWRSLLPVTSRFRAQAFVWFRAKTNKKIVCFVHPLHSVTQCPRYNIKEHLINYYKY